MYMCRIVAFCTISLSKVSRFYLSFKIISHFSRCKVSFTLFSC